ncbi:MAG: di-heme-cytochrome C peroxidase [Magnetospirillum sp.]|nr:di-heme-cytochrome C peroxidase [Magnetospirillum sp.]
MMLRHLGAAMVIAASAALAACNPTLPPEQKVGSVVYASPSWDKSTRDAFYWRQQGTVMMPLAWFKALEEPSGTQLISDRSYLSRFGFLVDDVPEGQLPVGFTPFELNGVTTLGLGCAACHTGQINYQGVGIRIDGGGALHNSALLTEVLGKSVMATAAEPEKFDRFAHRVLADKYGPETKNQLKWGFDQAAEKALNQGGYEGLHNVYPVEEGFGRLDALQRIANTLLGDDLHYQANKKQGTAPVRLPHIWDAPYFDWVQYNGSVRQPMIRNVGESLGVKAATNFVTPAGLPPNGAALWASSIPVHDLHATEEDLRKLKAPVWPKELPAVDTVLAYTKGKPLYDENCAGCHAPRPFARKDWPGVTFLQVPVVDVKEVGTDATLLTNFLERTYDATSLGVAKPISAGEGLWVVTEQIKAFQYQYGAKPVPKDKWGEYDGYGWPNEVRGTCGYKARPLGGIWANPPFLHNGSVPTVYDLLSPVSERPDVFWVGNREYDPVKLGYISTEFSGATRIDTGVIGNSNRGHEFADSDRPGVIGRALKPEERLAIIEYLKVLAEDPRQPTRKADEYAGDNRYPCWEMKIYWGPNPPKG